jgi:O-antigen ligase
MSLAAGLAVLIAFRFPKALMPMAGGFLMLLLLSPASFWYAFSASGSSMSDRMMVWQEVLASFWNHALFGEGLGARHRSYYNSQYVLLLSETGLIGLLLFSAWIASLVKALRIASKGQGLGASLCVASVAAVVGVSVQGLAAVCLLITSIAGSLYWLAGTSLAMAETTDAA